jgi:hypothetical protein
MVSGLTPGQAVGWGQIYFSHLYDHREASVRAEETRKLVAGGGFDQVLVVPSEPLSRLATASPHPDLISARTVSIANFALGRVHAFNQLVYRMTLFNALHAAEIHSAQTSQARRDDIAETAAMLSYSLHHDGIGDAWAARPGGVEGWYRALVAAVTSNINDLDDRARAARWKWAKEWPYILIDVIATAVVVATLTKWAWP